MADPPASSLSALVDLSDLLAPTEPCKSCGHPLREKRLATSKVTNLDSMAETARGGCLVCLILLKGSEEIGLSRPTTESVTVHTITDPATNITFKVADDEISYFLSPGLMAPSADTQSSDDTRVDGFLRLSKPARPPTQLGSSTRLAGKHIVRR